MRNNTSLKTVSTLRAAAVVVAVATVAVIIAFTGCVAVNISGSGGIAGKGQPETFEYKVGQYNKIKVSGFCEIQYYNGNNAAGASSDTVTLTIQPNLREHYTIEVIDNELIVSASTKIRYNSTNTPVLKIYTPELNRLNIDGACNFITHDRIASGSLELAIRGAGISRAELDVESLYVDLSGAGKFELSGKADIAVLNLSGAGELNALPLQTRDAAVRLSGAGAIKVSCSGNLRVNANGAGSVEYRGSPSLDLNSGGLVSIRQVQ